MTLPLPNLDDRRWSDLVEEGRALVPLYAPHWTDHNVHDPGITLMELLAWVAEMDIYWLNRVPDAHLRKFLALAGVRLRPPQPAQGALALQLAPGAASVALPAGVELTAQRVTGTERPLAYRTQHPLTVLPGQIAAIQRADGPDFTDLTRQFQQGRPISLWGDDPNPGLTLYIGLSEPLPADAQLSLFFIFAGDHATAAARERLLEELALRAQWCRPDPRCPEDETPRVGAPPAPLPLAHHAVRTSWSYRDAWGRWQPLLPEDGGLLDDTRAFTLNGRITLRRDPALPHGPTQLGAVARPLFYVRCRLQRGDYEAAPRLQHLLYNGVAVEQAVPVGRHVWVIAADATLPAEMPPVGTMARLSWRRNSQGQIAQLSHDQDAPALRLLAYRAPANGAAGRLALGAARVALGEGRPWQTVALDTPAVSGESLRLFTHERNRWVAWEARPDFDASGRAASHYLLDATTATIQFGDGERGRVPPAGAPIFATYDATQAAAGNLPANTTFALAPSEQNRALLGDPEAASAQLAPATNPAPLTGGVAAETLAQASGRARQERAQAQRAVTVDDYRALALATPGTQIARVGVWPNLHPGFPCFQAPGIVTVIVLPYLPAAKPYPSCALREQVAAYLGRRRVVGTRIEVVAPDYREVAVQATVQACPGVDHDNLRSRLIARLDEFLHPLHGGQDGDGWPFGRDVYRSEILQQLDETPGVDYVLDLELVADGGEPQCGNVCLTPLQLVCAGAHQIEVEPRQEVCDA